jgi:hypothetical protein
VREDCSKVALQYNGVSFGAAAGTGPVGASANYSETAVREADSLVAMLKEQRVGLCNNFNTCKLSVAEYRQEQHSLDDSFVALSALKDRMKQLDADGASRVMAELERIRQRSRGEAVAAAPVAAAAAAAGGPPPPGRPGTWSTVDGRANDIGVGSNGAVWIVGTNPAGGGFEIFRWAGTTWTLVPGGAVRIAVDPSGEAWVVNQQDKIFRHTAAGWQALPGAAKDIGVGPEGSVWTIGVDARGGGYAIQRWTGSDWQAIDGGAVRIAVGPQGQPWVVNATGAIFRRAADKWEQLPGQAKDIGVGADGTAWIIGTATAGGGHAILRWSGVGWDVVPGGAEQISVAPNGKPWVVNATSIIFGYY